MSRMLVAAVLFASLGVPSMAAAQAGGLGLRPMRLELELTPGAERTMSFTIESPPAENAVRGRLLLTLGDWRLAEDTSVSYHEPGTQPNSAAPWLVLSSGDLSIASGQQRLVRVTARVPEGAKPGVYTSSIFVQERPPAETPVVGDQRFYFRFRYVVTVYLIVTPVSAKGEVADAQLLNAAGGAPRLSARLTNAGTRHLRPTISWLVRSRDGEAVSVRNVEATVLLPDMSLTETLPLAEALPPGEYELEVQVDFHDGRPIQAVQRTVVVPHSLVAATAD